MSDDFSATSYVDGGDRVSSALRDEVWSLLRHNITPAIGRNRLREAAGAAYDNEDLARCFDQAADAIVALLPVVEEANSSAEFMRDKLSQVSSPVAPDRVQVAQLLRVHAWSAGLGGCFSGRGVVPGCDWHGGDAPDELERHADHVSEMLMPLLRGRSSDAVKAEALLEAADGNVPAELSKYDRRVVEAWLRSLAAEFDVKADTQKS